MSHNPERSHLYAPLDTKDITLLEEGHEFVDLKDNGDCEQESKQRSPWYLSNKSLFDSLPEQFSRFGSRHTGLNCRQLLGMGAAILVVILLTMLATMRFASTRGPTLSIPDLLRQLPFETSENMLNFTIPDHANLYPEPLGKQVCLIDVDNRPWNIEEGLLGGGDNKQVRRAWGRLNHYLYASLHGYDYKFVKAPPYDNRHNTWVKVREIHNILKQGYRFVVFTDADVIFPLLQLPLEEMMSYWNITSEIAMAGALDPNAPQNGDGHGRINVNTGFLIAQQTHITDQLMDEWEECPEETKFEGCARTKEIPFHEQSAYSRFIRYEFPNNTIDLPCSEANGRSTLKGECKGKFVEHYWLGKDEVQAAVEKSIARMVMPGMAAKLIDEWETHLEDHQ